MNTLSANTTVRAVAIALPLTMLATVLPASAHHSFPAQYNESKPVNLTGTARKVEWTNPHIFICIDVADEESGEVVSQALEMGGLNSLMLAGLSRAQ